LSDERRPKKRFFERVSRIWATKRGRGGRRRQFDVHGEILRNAYLARREKLGGGAANSEIQNILPQREKKEGVCKSSETRGGVELLNPKREGELGLLSSRKLREKKSV